MQALLLDMRLALRRARRGPALTLAVVLTLGVAIGMATSLFAVLNAVRFRMWPVEDPARVVRVWDLQPRGPTGLSVAEWRHLSSRTRSLTGLIASSGWATVTIEDKDGYYPYEYVSSDYLRVLGIPLERGRGFPAHHDRSEAQQSVAVISHRLWRRAFGGDDEIIGETIRLRLSTAEESLPFTVVGVAPPGFNGTSIPGIDLWLPLSERYMFYSREFARAHDDDALFCCRLGGRLAPGASPERAQAELQLLSDGFRASQRRPQARIRVNDTSDTRFYDGPRSAGLQFRLPFLAVGLVLFLACANVGNVLLARAQARRQEIAVRLALGASRRSVVRHVLAETFLLAVASGAVGVGIATALPRAVLRAVPVVSHLHVGPDHRVIAFAVALVGVACVGASLAPVLHATRSSMTDALKSAPGSLTRRFPLRESLLAVQVAACVILLVSAAMLARAIPLARTRGLGFDPDQVLVARIDLPSDYDPARRQSLGQQLLDQFATEPYARSVAGTSLAPFQGLRAAFEVPADPGHPRPAVIHSVSSAYLRLVGARIVDGRDLTPSDGSDRVAVVNEALAHATWPGERAVGRTLAVQGETLEVVGVARDANVPDLAGVSPALYRPVEPEWLRYVVIRDAGTGLSSRLSVLTAQIDSRASTTFTPLSVILEPRGLRLGSKLAALVGAIALVLAAFGLFGVFMNAVLDRTREIGIRMAIGARPVDVFGAVFATTGRSLAAGLGVGAGGAVVAARLLRHSLYGLGAGDPVAYLGVAVTLLLAGTMATYLPARRALRLDPAGTLRRE